MIASFVVIGGRKASSPSAPATMPDPNGLLKLASTSAVGLATWCRECFENPFALFRWNRVLLSATMRTLRSQSAARELIFQVIPQKGIVDIVPFRTPPGEGDLCAHTRE
jgi:hypothetical protein